MPLIEQRFRDMFRQAQHDRKQIVAVKNKLLRLFSVGATIGRPLLLINKNYLCHSERSRGISWKRIFSNSPRQGISVVLVSRRDG